MANLPRAQLRHLGIFVTDFDVMLNFYVELFGFHVSDQEDFEDGRRTAWLTLDPNAHHNFVITTGREADTPSTINQISFYVDTLDDVKAYWNALEDEPRAARRYGRTHGNAWSMYFWDPEGNRVEIYTDAPWHVSQPAGVNFDYSLSNEEIYALTEEYVQGHPERMPIEEFYAETAKALEKSL